MRIIRRVGALALALLFGHPALASPYKITGLDAAETWEIKAIGKYTDEHDGSLVEAPVIDATMPIIKGLEASATFGRGRLHEKGVRTREGWLDTEVAMKWEIVPLQGDGHIALTTEPALILPTGSHGLSDEVVQLEVPLVIGWDKGPLRLRGLVGYAHALKGSDDEISLGALAEYKLTPRFSTGIEVVSGMPSASIRDYETMLDVGFKWEIVANYELQARIGRSLRSTDHHAINQAAAYLVIAL